MITIPFGFGTAGFKDASEAASSVDRALSVGYRHFDTADHYEYTEVIGKIISDAAVPREDLTIATKLHSADLKRDSVISRTNAMRQELDIDVIDLLYVHWPTDSYNASETLGAMAQLRETGAIRHIGVCNFSPELLRKAVQTCPAPIVAHQFEVHPFLPQPNLIDVTRNLNMQVIGHSPFAGGLVFDSELLQTTAATADITVGQLVLAWLIQRRGICPLPKATGNHIGENYRAQTLNIPPSVLDEIDAIKKRHRVIDYDFAPWNK